MSAPVTNRSVSGGGRFEEIGSYARGRRVGPFIFVSGTTAVEPTGKLHAPNDTYRQTIYALRRIEDALGRLGGGIGDVVRTRSYLSDMGAVGDFVRAHGEVFKGVDPAATAVGAALTTPGMMVEVEVDAVVLDRDGGLASG